MVRFNIECILSFPQEEFWRIRDSPSFTKFIVEDQLLKTLSVATPIPAEQADTDKNEEEDDGYHRHPKRKEEGWMTREQQYGPANVDCPDFIRQIVGDTMFNVKDIQYWNERLSPFHISFTISPTFLTELSTTRGELTIEQFPVARQRENQNDLRAASLDVLNISSSSFTLNEAQHQQSQPQPSISVTPDSKNSPRQECDGVHEHKNISSKTSAADDIVSEIDSASVATDGTTSDNDCVDDEQTYRNNNKDMNESEKEQAQHDNNEIRNKQDHKQNENQNDKDKKPEEKQHDRNKRQNVKQPKKKSKEEVEKELHDFMNDCIDYLPPQDKSIHRIVGQTKVRILTLGWFVERAVAHNLKIFYKHYKHTVYRFRCKLYRDFAGGDLSVPISVVVDRLLEHEWNIQEHDDAEVDGVPSVENVSNGDEDEAKERDGEMKLAQFSCHDRTPDEARCLETQHTLRVTT